MGERGRTTRGRVTGTPAIIAGYNRRFMRLLRKASRQARSVREFVRGLTDTEHPLLVHIVPMRRCNIDCGYCNEFDKVSKPVPFDVMQRRIDRLAALGTSVVAFS